MTDVSLAGRPRRRGLRLRALVILILPLGLGMAHLVNYPRAIRRAVASVEAAGGKVTFDYQMGEPWICINGACFHEVTSRPAPEPPGPRWLRRLIGDEWFSDVAMVSFDYPHSPRCATDDVLATVSTFRRLEVLIVPFAQITDGGLGHLRRLDRLRSLDLGKTPIGDRGLASLAGLKNLEDLDLNWTQVTGAGLDQLVGLDKLKTLDLRGTRADDEGMSALARITSLINLNLDKTRVDASGLARLTPLKSLNNLYVSPGHLNHALSLKGQIPGLDVSAVD